ncbi:hypothetical protein EOI86_04625 [Hwanghaeella grinnelliae]|uniref:Uncharacterized protein n=1 Tax=Hwanghaeella grinnelliae TaxID=2500179 RepID=A0A3S3UR24_9PROT|nr:hypothetical protein [Hwanghaeella grinnelliae]RVU38570.1 hypothetical protein EOI86_04625 [Hwanghaeella grinnelliae]
MTIAEPWKPHLVVTAGEPAGAFFAEIGQAVIHGDMKDVWCCPVSIPSLLKGEKKIAGVDRE